MNVQFAKYLRVENKARHIPDVEYISSLGLSSSRGDENKIGQYGSGLVNSLALFARHGILEHIKLCLGIDVYTFSQVEKAVKDSGGYVRYHSFVKMKKQNGGTVDLNLSSAFGELDWTDVTMGVREVISNAIDGALEYNSPTDSIESFNMKLVDAAGRNCRAKENTIRFYLPLIDEIAEYYHDIHNIFICLRPEYDAARKILPNRKGGPAKIYRRGVLVGEFGVNSLFSYNLNNVKLDESRNLDSYTARDAAATAIATSNDVTVYRRFLEKVVNPVTRDESLWESSLPSYELNPENNYNIPGGKKEECIRTFKEALDSTFTGSVLCGNSVTSRMVESKGYCTIQVEAEYIDLLRTVGIKTDADILNRNEIEGREIVPASQNVLDVFDKVWENLERMGVTMGREKCEVKLFRQNTGIGILGYYRDNTCYILDDIAEDRGLILFQTILEELCHHITEFQDCTRDFQEFCLKVAAQAISKWNELYPERESGGRW